MRLVPCCALLQLCMSQEKSHSVQLRLPHSSSHRIIIIFSINISSSRVEQVLLGAQMKAEKLCGQKLVKRSVISIQRWRAESAEEVEAADAGALLARVNCGERLGGVCQRRLGPIDCWRCYSCSCNCRWQHTSQSELSWSYQRNPPFGRKTYLRVLCSSLLATAKLEPSALAGGRITAATSSRSAIVVLIDEIENVKNCCADRLSPQTPLPTRTKTKTKTKTPPPKKPFRLNDDDAAKRRMLLLDMNSKNPFAHYSYHKHWPIGARWKWRRRNVVYGESQRQRRTKKVKLAKNRLFRASRTSVPTVMQTLSFSEQVGRSCWPFLSPSASFNRPRHVQYSSRQLPLLFWLLLASAVFGGQLNEEAEQQQQQQYDSFSQKFQASDNWHNQGAQLATGWRLSSPFPAVHCASAHSSPVGLSSAAPYFLTSTAKQVTPVNSKQSVKLSQTTANSSSSRKSSIDRLQVQPVAAIVPKFSFPRPLPDRLAPKPPLSVSSSSSSLASKHMSSSISSSSGNGPFGAGFIPLGTFPNFAGKMQLGSKGDQPLDKLTASSGGLQISITPRFGQIRVPVESNAILKCLISSQADRFTKKFVIHWSRYMYDENVYEQIENFPANADQQQQMANNGTGNDTNDINYNQSQQDLSSVLVADNGERDFEAPINRQEQLRDFLSRSRQETNPISELLIEATLSISPVRANDNATYYCTATDGLIDQNRARIDLVALSRPIIHLDRVQPARDSKSAIIYWLILSDGNTPIKKTILMVRNDTVPGSSSSNVRSQESAAYPQQQQQFSSVIIDSEHHQWQRIDIPGDGDEVTGLAAEVAATVGTPQNSGSPYPLNPSQIPLDSGDSVVRADVDVTSSSSSSTSPQDDLYGSDGRSRWRQGRLNRRQRSFNLTSLLPGVTYQFRLAAINDMGQSNWTYLTATMPNEIPAQIQEMFLLSRSNDSLAIGWRRPTYDGAKTLRYEMQLFDLNRTLTLDANTNTSATLARTNFMYIFVNLNPGTDYHFHVRACSKAGCSAYSNPKLLASTLDGEPDEPLDVELNCQLESGNVTVNWLPPLNARGQLLNYSVSFNSYSKYQNQSGQWAIDEWRSQLETPDNHTLSLETGPILMPNTNYSVRVCANNRSKHCGRQSLLSARAQCSTLAQLPLELPPNLKLTTNKRRFNQSNSNNDQDESESLALELPLMSRRNGTIDCIQASDHEEQKNDMSNNKTVEQQQQPQEQSTETGRKSTTSGGNEKAEAYLADELDQSNWEPTSEEQAAGFQLVLLGNGANQVCKAFVEYLSEVTAANAISPVVGRQAGSSTGGQLMPKLRVFDGSLKPQTYYTGFIKLILMRPSISSNLSESISHNGIISTSSSSSSSSRSSSSSSSSSGSGSGSGSNGINSKNPSQQQHERILVKYSNYFNPVKTSDSVPAVALPNSEDFELEQKTTVHFANPFKLNSQMSFQEMISRVASGLRVSLVKVYNSTSNFVSKNVRLEPVGNFIMRSSPLMQLFEVAIIVLGVALFLLFIIYLLSLPASMRRKRKRKLKRQLQMKQQEVANQMGSTLSRQDSLSQKLGAQNQPNGLEALLPAAQQIAEDDAGFVAMQRQQQQRQQQNLHALASSMGYQQVDDSTSKQMLGTLEQQQQLQQHLHQQQQAAYAATTLQRNQECPIHSSPLHRNNQQIQLHQVNGYIGDQPRSMPVHICQPQGQQQQQQQQDSDQHTHVHAHTHVHQHPHQSHHNQHQLAVYATTNQELLIRQQQQQQQYDRNCRTMRRVHAGEPSQVVDGDQMSSIGSKNFTLSHHNSILALARKINKSIPLRLFRSVFEYRLRNGWLKEEYEQLPRQLTTAGQLGIGQQQLRGSGGNRSSLLLKLRPQLIVSRNDSASALISGNDQFDASLIRMSVGGNSQNEKRIICAKSPLDADSVWDFWRLAYEQEVSTMVMLTQNEDPNTGETRCAQYWPTCDNEETTILSPCNEYVQKSTILPAKFKIRQETLEEESREDDYRVRLLTLMVMATKPGENEQSEPGDVAEQANNSKLEEGENDNINNEEENNVNNNNNNDDEDEDEKELVIVERTILHLQFYYWNTSSLANQMRLIKFIEVANEKHLHHTQRQRAASETTPELEESSPPSASRSSLDSPMLVHCYNGLGRSGLFTAMSFIINDLAFKLSREQQLQKLNIFQLVSQLRAQREMLLSPYRLYELLYQLTSNCIPAQERSSGQLHQHQQQQQLQQQQHQH